MTYSWMALGQGIPLVYAGPERKNRQQQPYCCYRRLVLFNRPCRNLGLFALFALGASDDPYPVCLKHFSEMSTWVYLKSTHPEKGVRW